MFTIVGFRTIQDWKNDMKRAILLSGHYVAESKIALEKACRSKTIAARYSNIAEARKAFEGFDFPEEWLHYACIPDSPASFEAYCWLFKFFTLVGDNAPNRNDKIQIPGKILSL